MLRLFFIVSIIFRSKSQEIVDRAIGSEENECPKHIGENACSEVNKCCYNRIKLNGKEHKFCLNKKDQSSYFERFYFENIELKRIKLDEFSFYYLKDC